MNHKKIDSKVCVTFSIVVVFVILNGYGALQLIMTYDKIIVSEVAYQRHAEIELESNGETFKVNAVEKGGEKELLTTIDFRRNKKTSKEAAVTKNPGQVAHHEEDRVIVGGGACPNNKDANLEFIHIRKTGGSAIEKFAKDHAGLWWGEIAIERRHRYKGMELDRIGYQKAAQRTEIGNRVHIPPKFYVPYPFEANSTFVVTRDPYDRAVSEYYQKLKGLQLRKSKGKTTLEPLSDADIMKEFVKNSDTLRNSAEMMNIFIQDGIANPRLDSFIPQYHYVFNENGERIVTHVLEFKNLNKEFNALMKCYSIPGKGNTTLELPKTQVNSRIGGTELTQSNFTEATIRAINDHMQKDFELLGYSMMDPVQ
eukprot:scaffold10220_cov272-Chaetoceros_neogracile.AAC.66